MSAQDCGINQADKLTSLDWHPLQRILTPPLLPGTENKKRSMYPRETQFLRLAQEYAIHKNQR